MGASEFLTRTAQKPLQCKGFCFVAPMGFEPTLPPCREQTSSGTPHSKREEPRDKHEVLQLCSPDGI